MQRSKGFKHWSQRGAASGSLIEVFRLALLAMPLVEGDKFASRRIKWIADELTRLRDGIPAKLADDPSMTRAVVQDVETKIAGIQDVLTGSRKTASSAPPVR